MRTIGDLERELPALDGLHESCKVRIAEDKTRLVCRYIDVPLCFDCETYSFTVLGPKGGKEKRAVMWAWGLAVGETCFLGRTWPEMVEALEVIVRKWEITPEHRCIIWVHNLSYDFQFFRKWFKWEQIFALSSREVCYAVTVEGVEFRCSYILTGYSLEKVGEHLTGHTMKKLTGTIKYDIPRHPGTPLDDDEVAYLEHDCLVVTAHIDEQIELEGGLAKMPLTKTGYVRRDVQRACFRDPSKKAKDDWSKIRYSSFIQGLTMDDFIYESLHRAFAGGFTHANPFHSGEVMEQVASYDFASAYPAVMCSEYFPATPPQLYKPKDTQDFYKTLKLYCCVFTVTFFDLEPKVNFDHYLSSSHCTFPVGSMKQLDNGRVVRAKELTTTITNVDWEIIIRCYQVSSNFKIDGLIRWGKGYLPKPIVQCVIKYFQAKTQLKGVAGMEQEYMTAKENLNSIYGMMVTNPVRPLIPYDLDSNEWGEETSDGRRILEKPLSDPEREKALAGYNDSISRFTYYAWGVFVTAYCRKNLWRGILHFKDDYIYADTDSLKVVHADLPEHQEHIEKHNQNVQKKIKECLKFHGMDEALSCALTPSGKSKALGVWEYEGTYTRFKTLGAKRYMVESMGRAGGPVVSLTVSGINKREAIPYILSQTAGPMRTTSEGGGDPFEYFTRDMEIPAGHAGKMIPYYGDEMITGKLRDRFGNVYEYTERSYVYLEPGGYNLSLAPEYVTYLQFLQKGLI